MSDKHIHKRFKITIEGDSLNLSKGINPICNKIIPKFDLGDAVTLEEDQEKNYFIITDKIKMERIE